jgi:hypothetical protein
MIVKPCPSRSVCRPAGAGSLAALVALSLGLVALPACAPDTGSPAEAAGGDEDTAAAEQPLVTAPINLALGKTTSQSSTAFGGDPGRAVDGNTSGNWSFGSVTHTDIQANAWWQVDLGSSQTLTSVVLYNRTDCCSDRLTNFSVLVSDDQTSWRLAALHPGSTPSQITLSLNDRVTGAAPRARYLRVQLNGTNYLSLAEVQVYGPPLVDIAYKKPVWQSSTYNGDGPAWHAVDGKTDGVWPDLSVSSTDWQSQPWLTVDLGSPQPIAGVVLWNRTDCCADRLSNFRLMLSNDDATWTTYNYPGTAPASVTFNVNATARYVAVQLNGYGMLTLAELQVLAAPRADRVRSVDLGGAAPGVTNYLERWEDSHTLDPLLDPADRHLKGDFMGLGHDQALHFNLDGGAGTPRVQVLDYAGAPAGGTTRYLETWGQSNVLDGWLDGGDLQLAGDFRGLGHSQVMYVNRDGGGGKIMIVDYSGGVAPGAVQYWENWGDSSLLNGWLDGGDLQLVGDFMGLGHSQVMYVNRSGTDGKVMIVDYAGAVPGSAKYFEMWGQSPLLGGWLDGDDLQLVGDFMGLGHSQVMYVNRGGTGGKVMIVDYAGGAAPGTVKYLESWGQTAQLGSWIDAADVQLVGDFTGVGHDELLTFNTLNQGDGKLQALDYGAGSWPATQRYYQPWSQTGELNDWPAPRDLLLAGKFTSSGHAELLSYHIGQSTAYTSPAGNPGCPGGQIPTASGGCAPGCPAGQSLVDDTSCVTLVPWNAPTFPDGARVTFRVHSRIKYWTGCSPDGMGIQLFCGQGYNEESYGPAFLKITDHAGQPYLDASAPALTRTSFFAVTRIPNYYNSPNGAFRLRGANGNYVGGEDPYGAMLVTRDVGTGLTFDFDDYSYYGTQVLMIPDTNYHWTVTFQDFLWGTLVGSQGGVSYADRIETFLVE